MHFNYRTIISFFLLTLGASLAKAQLLSNKALTFTHADTLRGIDGPARKWWDALKYDLHVTFNIEDSSIRGYNAIQFKALKKGKRIQIDLQEPMVLDSITYFKNGENGSIQTTVKKISKDGNAYFFDISLNANIRQSTFTVYYHGKPLIAIRPPWDGGLIMKKDQNNNPWISLACQGLGASVWYPCKDYQGDEPDSAEMHITVPDNLIVVGNGRFRGKILHADNTATYDWAVVSPINNYDLIPYIGKYVHFGEIYEGEAGKLDMDYWVLDSNLTKAKEHFKDAPRMMKAFEYWFGPYPFYQDGYKLVDAPHLGMEHQSATAYGNQYKNGYLGHDLSGSGWGLKWDYIIIHESGHEWFGNNITTKDIADEWVHEGITSYSEMLYVEYYYGKAAATAYITGLRRGISNNEPVIGPYGVNKEGSGDRYPKGANMMHTIRQVINNDSLFRNILRGLNKTFYHQTVTSKQIENYISKQSHIDFGKVFDQYLRQVNIPVLEYRQKGNQLQYRYTRCVKGFNMPLKINLNGEHWIKPTEQWQTSKFSSTGDGIFTVDPNFYIITKISE